MAENPVLNQALSLALTLSPKERLYLISRVASSVEHEFTDPAPNEHWGQKADALLEQLDTSAWQALDMPDPTEWLRQQREDERRRRLAD